MKKKRSQEIRRTVMINSRQWILESRDIAEGGGLFMILDKTGVGRIMIHTRDINRRHILEILLHEVLEAILTDDGRRWGDNIEGKDLLFCFDHNYLENLGPKLVDALVSCGVIDPNKKVL